MLYGASSTAERHRGRSLQRWERKVRAPQGRVVDNIDRPKGSGKCNRKQTAAGVQSPRQVRKQARRLLYEDAAARVKRCGKSAPAAGATRLAWQTPPGARPSRARARGNTCTGRPGLNRRSGRLLETPGNRRPREMAVRCARPIGRRIDKTRLTGPLRDRFSVSRNQTWSRRTEIGRRWRLTGTKFGSGYCGGLGYSTVTSSASMTCSSLLMQSWFMLVLRS